MSVTKAKGSETRERILDLADNAVLEKSFANTSLEEIVAAAGISKNGFFYHFKSKDELAKALIERYMSQNTELITELFTRAESLHDDPLEAFLAVTEMYVEMMKSMPAAQGSVLINTYSFQDQRHNSEVRALGRELFNKCRGLLVERLDVVAAAYPPQHNIEVDDLANHVLAIIEGSTILASMMGDKSMLINQLLLTQKFLRYAFTPANSAGQPAG